MRLDQIAREAAEAERARIHEYADTYAQLSAENDYDRSIDAYVEWIIYGLLEGPTNAVQETYDRHNLYPLQSRDTPAGDIDCYLESLDASIIAILHARKGDDNDPR